MSRFAAVIRTLGVLSVGASACGSSSSTGTHGSTSSVVKKEAGLLHVELVVYNMTGHSLDLQLLRRGKANTLQNLCGNGVPGTVAYNAGCR